MTNAKNKIQSRLWVSDISDERGSGNSIIIGLAAGYNFRDDPGCGTCGFDTWSDAERGTRESAVYKGEPL